MGYTIFKYEVSMIFDTLPISVALVLVLSDGEMQDLLFILIFMIQQSHATHGVAYSYATKGFTNVEEVSCNNLLLRLYLPLINIISSTFNQY